MAYGLAVGGLLIALVGIPAMVRQDWTSIGAPAWIILVYAIVGPVYLAYMLWNWAISRRGIPRTVVYAFLVPVWAEGSPSWPCTSRSTRSRSWAPCWS